MYYEKHIPIPAVVDLVALRRVKLYKQLLIRVERSDAV